MIDFPASPTNGQVFTSGAQSWTWDGTKWVASGNAVMPPLSTGDNRIINGDCRIDQRNNGASGTATGYTVDRWVYNAVQPSKGGWQRLASGAGLSAFPYSLGFTSVSAYAVLTGDTFYFAQYIEADMVSDFAWGTASAQPVMLSFWAFSTLTGTFGGAVCNHANTRSYPFTFSLPAASTWTKIAITIPGDTAGTWVMSGSGAAIDLRFDLGSGATYRAVAGAWANGNFAGVTGAVNVVSTNGAVFLVTGVKLEIGSVATPYNRQSLAKSMADCQRYYQIGQLYLYLGGPVATASGQTFVCSSLLPVNMRSAPTLVATTNSNSANLGAPTLGTLTGGVCVVVATTSGGGVIINTSFTASAEL